MSFAAMTKMTMSSAIVANPSHGGDVPRVIGFCMQALTRGELTELAREHRGCAQHRTKNYSLRSATD
jgi:hypothetical protein